MENVDTIIQMACDAALRGDATKVMSTLQSPLINGIPIGLDEPLLPPSTIALCMLEKLDGDSDTFHPEHVLRALVSIPHYCETPWRAALTMIQADTLSTLSDDVLRISVTDIQTFLQLTVEAWWKRERLKLSAASPAKTQMPTNLQTTNTTPRHWLQQLVDAILNPLCIDSVSNMEESLSCNHDYSTQMLEIITTIVSLCRDLEQPNDGTTTISDYIMDSLFPSRIVPDRLLPWLTCTFDLYSQLRSKDVTRLYEILHCAITNEIHSIPTSDLSGIVRVITSFLAKQSQSDEQQDWEQLMLHLLYAAAQDDDASTYSTVETALKDNLASLPNAILEKWIARVKNAPDSIPKWICANMNLMLLEAIQQSGSGLVSNLVLRALDSNGGGDDNDMLRGCWESLQELVFSFTNSGTSKKRGKQNTSDIHSAVKTAFEGVCYRGNGQFVTNVGNSAIANNLSSTLICQSIFLSENEAMNSFQEQQISERALLWIRAADTILRPSVEAMNGGGPHTSLDAMFAVMILVTVYCEVPVCRSTIVRNMTQSLSAQAVGDLSSLQCVVIAMIVRSLSSRDSLDDGCLQKLYPISTVFGQSLEKGVFYELTTALSSLSPARSALLSASQTCLQSSIGGNLLWYDNMETATASRGMQENLDKVDCALYGLCTLIATSESQPSWDSAGIEAWCLLSDVLVQNIPALPTMKRSDLFRRLVQCAEQNMFSINTIEHLQRACLVRLLQFFEGHEERPLELVLDRLFMSWGTLQEQTEASIPACQREDIVGLFRLIIQLLGHQTSRFDEDSSVKQRVRQGRDRILRVLVDDDILDAHSSYSVCCSDVVCECLVAALFGAMSIVAGARTKIEKRSQVCLKEGKGVKQWREHFLVNEIEAFRGLGMEEDSEGLPSWLKRSSRENFDGFLHRSKRCEVATKSRLLSSLCDVVLDVIFHPVYSNDDSVLSTLEEQMLCKKRLTKCSVALITLKRELSRQFHGGINVVPSEPTELLFDNATLCASAVAFLELCSDFFDASISQSVSLETLDDTMLSLLTYCCSLKQIASSKENMDHAIEESRMIQIVRQLWSLYLAIADDTSAQRFVGYLEKEGMAQMQRAQFEVGPPKNAFLTVRSDDDIDAIIQCVRLTIVSTLGALLHSLTNMATESSAGLDTGTISLQTAPAKKRLSTGFWLQVLRHLCSDVKAGLDGRSGGMTEGLYTAYLSLIESACKLVSLAVNQEVESTVLLQVSKVSLVCASFLKEIFCGYPLNGATQFKKTMMLSISELPSLHREANFVMVISGSDHPRRDSNGFALEVFYQMMRVTERCHRVGNLLLKDWSEIAGAEHVPPDDDSSNDDDSMGDYRRSSKHGSTKDGVPSTIVLQGDNCTSRADAGLPLNDMNVQLPSKESWLWASCCSLAAMEQVWTDSYSILNGNTPVNSNATPLSSSSLGSYYLGRTSELSEILKAVCFAMKTFKELKDTFPGQTWAKKKAETVLATSFDDSVKIKFLSLLEKVSSTLNASLRYVSSQLKNDDGMNGVICTEAMACVTAWLTVGEDGLDIESLSNRWYQAEKELHNENSRAAGGVHKRMTQTLRRLPKLLVRTQELETDLTTFYQTLEKMSMWKGKEETDASRQQETLSRYESLLNNTETNEKISLQAMIKTKLTSLAKARATSQSFNLKLVGKGDDPPAKRRRKSASLERQIRRERRKGGVKRSRNQIVDEWMQLDGEYEMDEGVDDDAYVDLEDFIV